MPSAKTVFDIEETDDGASQWLLCDIARIVRKSNPLFLE